MKTVEGEMIQLNWEGDPDAFFIRGHVSPKDFMLELEDQDVMETGFSRLVEADGHRNWVWQDALRILGPITHRYARWSMEPGDDGGYQVLRDYKDPGRGRFKVTMADVIGLAPLSHCAWE
jgi:hypothetical protein